MGWVFTGGLLVFVVREGGGGNIFTGSESLGGGGRIKLLRFGGGSKLVILGGGGKFGSEGGGGKLASEGGGGSNPGFGNDGGGGNIPILIEGGGGKIPLLLTLLLDFPAKLRFASRRAFAFLIFSELTLIYYLGLTGYYLVDGPFCLSICA